MKKIKEILRDSIIVIIGIIMSPFILLYELIRYLCKKLKTVPLTNLYDIYKTITNRGEKKETRGGTKKKF